MHVLIEGLIIRKGIPGTGHNGTDKFVQQSILILNELGDMMPPSTDHPDVRAVSQAIDLLRRPLLDWQRLRAELK
jgi:hypothetical protein